MNEEIKNILYVMVNSVEWVAMIETDNPDKKVSFKPENEVFFINDRNYLRENNLCKDLWYTLQEMSFFKHQAIADIQLFIFLNPGYTSKEAMRIMWNDL